MYFTVYVDMGAQASDTATLNFAFSGASSNRAWEVKATQIPCASRSAYVFFDTFKSQT